MKALRQKQTWQVQGTAGRPEWKGHDGQGETAGGRMSSQRGHAQQHSVTGDSDDSALSGMEGSRVP